MQGWSGRAQARGRSAGSLWVRVASIAICGLCVAGCTTTGSRPGPNATVAFESIDGPPPATFKKLVQKLNEEAEAKKVPIVSRENAAPYRIRGYVALGIEKKQKRTIVSWVWDVYDTDLKRSFRLSGEEIAGPAGRNGWDAANDEVLTRVARAGMDRLAAYFQSPASAAPEPASEPAAPQGDGDRDMTVATIAGRDDFRPEFRAFSGSSGANRQPIYRPRRRRRSAKVRRMLRSRCPESGLQPPAAAKTRSRWPRQACKGCGNAIAEKRANTRVAIAGPVRGLLSRPLKGLRHALAAQAFAADARVM